MRHILKKDPTCTRHFVRFACNVWRLNGDDEQAPALAGVDAPENFFRESGLPMALTKLNIGTEHFKKMAARANYGGCLANTFVVLTDRDIAGIYKACLCRGKGRGFSEFAFPTKAGIVNG